MNNKGVTLIELLIVIVVLGIISAFAIPAVGDIITNTEKESVLQDARSLVEQARIYCGAGNCTATEEATGLAIDDLSLEVFNYDKYEETDGDATGDGEVVVKKVSGVWVVQLTADPTNGEYNFGLSTDETAFVDPINATKDNVFVPAP